MACWHRNLKPRRSHLDPDTRHLKSGASLFAMANLTLEQFLADHRQRLEALYRASGAERWSVPFELFARAAWQGIAGAALVESREIPQLLNSLRSEDLALALGCAQGNEPAWDTFCSKYRSVLYEAARALARQEAQARDLADSLLADLYGLDSSESGRRSRFMYFHGRSSLKTWLRAVLYQEFVDEHRRQSRLVPLPEDPTEGATAPGSLSEQDDRRYAQCLSEAVEVALGELSAPGKLLLSYYYVQGLTLKQIGRLTGEHEATVSRHLETLRKQLRKRMEGYLRRVRKLSAFEFDRCLEFASRGVDVSLERVLKPE